MKISSTFFLISIISLLAFPMMNANAQSLTFCRSVDEQEMPANATSEFSISKDGGLIIFFLQLPSSISARGISYDIYKIDNGKEVFNTTIDQPVVSGRSWLSKEVTIYEPGYYRVYVYDENDKLITKGSFTAKKATG